MSSSDENMEFTPPDLKEKASLAMEKLFPAKSKERYVKSYESFMKWRNEKKANTFSESVFLAYFSELAKSKQPSTLWAMYSMIKFTMNVKHNINLRSYAKLTAYLKRQSDGHISKKAKVFTSQNITQFLNEAPDDTYLATKVALILGVNGACRCIELYNLSKHDVTQHDDVILVKLWDTKTKIDRQFVVPDEYFSIIQKYQALRPASTTSDKFFLNYRKGKCYNQVIGRHKISTFPKEVAMYLNLPSSESYTGHCFRRTSATLLADSGANLITLKRHGGWKSDKVAEGYIEDSIANKTKITDQINKNIQYNISNNQQTPSRRESNAQASTSHLSPQPSTSRQFSPQPLTSSTKIESSTSAARHVSPTKDTDLPSVSNTQTNISVPGKSVNLTFNNCTLSNITFNMN